jgi:uncharacterized protein
MNLAKFAELIPQIRLNSWKMKKIPRFIQHKIVDRFQAGKVIVLYGARRTGKTFLLRQMLKEITEPYLLLNGEDMEVQRHLAERSAAHYRILLGDCRVLIIDEAQKIPDIGAKLKLMVDEIEGLKVVATGSSAFDLHHQFGEPLTGRKISFHLFPIAEMEWAQEENRLDQAAGMRERMVSGSYPELMHLSAREQKTNYLRELVSSYLLKDILEMEGLRYSGRLLDLLRLVAYQVGSEVSLNELAKQIGMDTKTVAKYLDMLEQVFVIFKIRGYSMNLRKEIVKNSKFYFYDNGIRNALISNFNPLEIRNDSGILWENYMVSERLKMQHYTDMAVNNFFWRTYDQQEIDWIEEREGQLFGYEMKWGQSSVKPPSAWRSAYPQAHFKVIHPDNFRDFIGA